jgi:transcriptional regulator with XRE-family HTH domain
LRVATLATDTFAKLFRAARVRHGLTQRELAERLGGMRQPKIAMLESGERHPPRNPSFYERLGTVFDPYEVDAIIGALPWKMSQSGDGLHRASVQSSETRKIHVEVRIHADHATMTAEELDRLQSVIDADVRLRLAEVLKSSDPFLTNAS